MDTKRNLVILKLYFKPILISFGIGLAIYLLQIYGALVGKIDFAKAPFNLILDFLYYNTGWLISIVIPSTFLFSTIYVFSRLPYESFYEEFKYERRSFTHFIFPIGIIAILFSIALYIHNNSILSEFNYKAKNSLIQLSRISNLPANDVDPDDIYTTSRSKREMSLDMLKAQLDYLINLKKTQGKSEAFFDYLYSDIKRIESEIQKRYAISFSQFFFVIFAVPLGFLIRKKHTIIILSIGFILSLIYWLMIIFLDKLVTNLYPLILWLPNFIYLIVGIVLLIISTIKFKRINL